MLVSGNVGDRTEVRGGSDFSGEDGIVIEVEAHSPPSRSMSPGVSPSPPPPPPPVSSRWSEFGSFRTNMPSRMQTTNSGLSYGDSESCPQCRDRYATFKRNNSIQSSTTVNSYTGSTQPRKEAAKVQ
ncbi:hypothetical protein RUM44_010545 [Polyplax serrata]